MLTYPEPWKQLWYQKIKGINPKYFKESKWATSWHFASMTEWANVKIIQNTANSLKWKNSTFQNVYLLCFIIFVVLQHTKCFLSLQLPFDIFTPTKVTKSYFSQTSLTCTTQYEKYSDFFQHILLETQMHYNLLLLSSGCKRH